PGALAAIAAALMSGREAWRSHIPYFAFFGALGWAFGGSISNMHPPTSVDRLGRQQPPFRTRRRLARQAHPQIQASQLTGYLDVYCPGCRVHPRRRPSWSLGREKECILILPPERPPIYLC